MGHRARRSLALYIWHGMPRLDDPDPPSRNRVAITRGDHARESHVGRVTSSAATIAAEALPDPRRCSVPGFRADVDGPLRLAPHWRLRRRRSYAELSALAHLSRHHSRPRFLRHWRHGWRR